MKRHNINAVRTSPLPAAPRLPRPVRRVRPVGHRRVRPGDPRLHRAGLARTTPSTTTAGPRPCSTAPPAWSSATRTTRRVVIWSLGNEAGTGRGLTAMAEWIRGPRPLTARPLRGRPATAATPTSTRRMYAVHDEVERDRPRAEDAAGRPAGRAAPRAALHPVRVRARHGQRPRRPRRLPAAVRDATSGSRAASSGSGSTTASPAPPSGTYYAYGGDFGEELHDGNFVCDGLLFPDRTPSPGWSSTRRSSSRSASRATGRPARSGSPTGTTSPTCPRSPSSGRTRWTARRSARGALTVPPLAPGESAEVKLPDAPADRAGRRGPVDGTGACWPRTPRGRAAGHEVAWAQAARLGGRRTSPCASPPRRRRAATATGSPSARRTFDARTGA